MGKGEDVGGGGEDVGSCIMYNMSNPTELL